MALFTPHKCRCAAVAAAVILLDWLWAAAAYAEAVLNNGVWGGRE